MASAEECREALQTLTGRLGEMNPEDRASFFSNRTFSCHVTDLGVTFVTRFTENGAEPVKEARPDEPPADIRLTASSDDVVSLAATPANIARMWISRAGQDPGQHARPAGPASPAVAGGSHIPKLSSHGRPDPAAARRDRVEPGGPAHRADGHPAHPRAARLPPRHWPRCWPGATSWPPSPVPPSARSRPRHWRAWPDAKPDPDLWEWDYGGYEGLTTSQIQERHPGWYLWRDGVIPGDAEHPGETVEQVGRRADRVLARAVPLLATEKSR